MAGRRPAAEDCREALWRVLAGLAQGDDAFDLAASVAVLHRADDTFLGEIFMSLAAGALDCAGVSRQDPIRSEGLLERYPPECEFRVRQNQKIKFAVLRARRCAAGWNQTCSAR